MNIARAQMLGKLNHTQTLVEKTVRIAADTVMINVALLLAVIVRHLWLRDVEGARDIGLASYLHMYVSNALLITPLCLLVFAGSGFYTYGRRYRGRYKALIIVQAVSLSYLVVATLSFLLPDVIELPRSELLLAWGMTLALISGARLWTLVWRTLAQFEPQLAPQPTAQEPQRVLVIGGAGYVGSALLPRLLAQGYRVRLLDLLLFGTEPIADVLDHPNLEIIQADFRQVDKVVNAVAGVDAVIHLGAIVGDPACALDEALTIEVNLMATRMIAEVAKGSGVKRFIFASTCSVYGASDEILDERSSLNPVSLYARSKIASEQVLRQLSDDHFAPVVLRFGTIYGLSGRTRFDLVVNLLAAKAVVDGQITVMGGDQWRPFVHVDDAALAVFSVLNAPDSAVHNQVFNVGSDGQNYTIGQVGELIHQMVPRAQLLDLGSDDDRRNYRVSFSKIRNTLGFEPQHTLEAGITQVVTAISTGKVTDYKDERYSNVKFLRGTSATRLLHYEYGWVTEALNDSAPAPVPVPAVPLLARAVGG